MNKKSECSILQLRREGAEIVARVRVAGERFVVTNYGKPQAALVSLEDLKFLEEKKKSPTNLFLVDEGAPSASQIANYQAVRDLCGPRQVQVHSVSIKDFPKSMRPKKRKGK